MTRSPKIVLSARLQDRWYLLSIMYIEIESISISSFLVVSYDPGWASVVFSGRSHTLKPSNRIKSKETQILNPETSGLIYSRNHGPPRAIPILFVEYLPFRNAFILIIILIKSERYKVESKQIIIPSNLVVAVRKLDRIPNVEYF